VARLTDASGQSNSLVNSSKWVVKPCKVLKVDPVVLRQVKTVEVDVIRARGIIAHVCWKSAAREGEE
jgi:hypothetical protein